MVYSILLFVKLHICILINKWSKIPMGEFVISINYFNYVHRMRSGLDLDSKDATPKKRHRKDSIKMLKYQAKVQDSKTKGAEENCSWWTVRRTRVDSLEAPNRSGAPSDHLSKASVFRLIRGDAPMPHPNGPMVHPLGPTSQWIPQRLVHVAIRTVWCARAQNSND